MNYSISEIMQLRGFQPNNPELYCASTLRTLPRDRVLDRLQLQVAGVSIDWDHVFVALKDKQYPQQLIYWSSDNITRLLTVLRHQSLYANDIIHVILQDRHITLLLTRSCALICLKEVKDEWEVSVIGENVTSVAACDVKVDSNNMKFVAIQNGLLAFLTADHTIHSSLLPNVMICEVSCGANHVLLLDTKGHVYSCGHGNRGQLGHDDTISRNIPTVIELTVAMTIIKISAGGWHSAMLSGCHDIYTNGWNCDGQLGHNINVAMVIQPTLITTDDEFRSIACGSRHTVAISNHNDVYSWGWNKYKQLEPWHQPHPVIQDVKCGQWNTLYLTV